MEKMYKSIKKSHGNWIDSHCHLDLIQEDFLSIQERSSQLGIRKIITIGINQQRNEKVLEYIRHKGIYGTLGIHPHDSGKSIDEDFNFIEKNIRNEAKIVGIGECGFDYHYNYSLPAQQKEIFERQMEIALRLDVPIIIHTRDAENDTIETMKPYMKKGLRGIFHSFTSNHKLAHFALENDFYFSFNGICTFPKSTEVREVLALVPKNRILIETDAPFLAPVPYRGKTNFPGYVSFIGKFIADFLSIPEDEFALITRKNTEQLFPQLIHEN